MRILFLTTLFIGGLLGWNSLPRQARERFAEGKYQDAARLFEEAIGEYSGQRASLEFNISQTWLAQDSNQRALNWYGRAAANKQDGFVASLAHNNLGVLWNQKETQPQMMAADPTGEAAQAGDPIQNEINQLDRSLEAFKSALRRDSENEFARYNYELLKRKKQQLQQQQQQQQQEEKKEEEKQDQQKEEKDDSKQNQPQKKQNSPQNTEGKGMDGKQEQISVEEARQLLEAMKDNEKKFIQQLQKSKKHKTHDQDGPDW